MKWESRFKGDYISAAELGDKRPTLTISRITICRIEDDKKKKDVDKPVMWFKEIDRGWMYCKTTGHACAAMFGEDDEQWIGKRLTLYADPNVSFGGDQVGGIRIAGSPDIEKPIQVRIKFPKKKAFDVHLVPTKASTKPPAQQSGPAEQAPIK